MPYPCGGKASSRLQMQVEHGSMRILALGMGEVNAYVCLERLLVVRKARVAVDAKQRTTRRSRVGDEVRAQLMQMRREGVDERQRRLHRALLKPLFVLREPIAIVIAF